MATFFSKLSNFRGQETKDELKDHLRAVDEDLNNLFKGAFLFPDYDIIKLVNRTGLPSSTAYIGYFCVVSGTAYLCTVSGTPGTWTIVGSQS